MATLVLHVYLPPTLQVNQLSAYLEVSALCLLVVGLAVPSSRNLMMLIVYGQSVHVRVYVCIYCR